MCEREEIERKKRQMERERTLSRGMCEKRSLMKALDFATTLLHA